MRTVVARPVISSTQDIDIAQLLRMPVPDIDGTRSSGTARSRPRSRFLGLWTFANRQYSPNLVARIAQTPVEDDRMVDLASTVRAQERRNAQRALAARTHSVRIVNMALDSDDPTAISDTPTVPTTVSVENNSQAQQYSDQLQRSRQIDNMIHATA